MYIILFILFILFVFYRFDSFEFFQNEQMRDKYQQYLLETPLKKQKFLTFMSYLIDNNPHDSVKLYSTEFKRNYPEECVRLASDICEFTDVRLYNIDNKYAIAPGKIKAYQNLDAPTNTDLRCFNRILPVLVDKKCSRN